MNPTNIPYLTHVWNPVTGCTACSPACDNCWAERMARRFAGRAGFPAGAPFLVTRHPDRLNQPLKRRKPATIGVAFMGDLFHEAVPDAFLDQVFAVMALARWHTFVVLTKRPLRMREYMSGGTDSRVWQAQIDTAARWDIQRTRLGQRIPQSFTLQGESLWPLPNVWLGVSVWDQASADRNIPALLDTPAAVRWVSLEPMLGPVRLGNWIGTHNCHLCYPVTGAASQRFFLDECGEDSAERTVCPRCRRAGGVGTWDSWMGRNFDGPGIDWVVLGGESGPGARPMHPQWARDVRDQCADAGVPFWFKQHSQAHREIWELGDHLDGEQHHGMPDFEA